MRLPSLKIDRREYVLIPKAEYRRWKERGKRTKGPKAAKSVRTAGREQYTDERIAEFLLTNTTDAQDYRRACKLVRKMGLDPAKIDHDKPIGTL